MSHLISAVITTFNLAWCIREAIESVLTQTYPCTEIIVIDDASTDDSEGIINSFGPRVKWIQNSRRNGNPAINRNIGIQAAAGEYIAFLDGDDLWDSGKLALQVAMTREYPTAGLIAVDGIQFNHGDKKILKPSLYSNDIPWPANSENQIINLHERLLQGCCIDTPSQILVPKRVLEDVQGFTPDLPHEPGYGYGEDYEFMLKVSAKYDFAMSRRKLVRYRYSESTLSSAAQQNVLAFVLGDLNILQRHFQEANERHRAIIRDILRDKIIYACRRGIEESRSGRRIWASLYLLNLLKRYLTTRTAGLVAVSLARIWRPNVVARILRAVRSLGRNKTET